MAKLTREEYQFYKSQDPKDLTQEDLNDINEFESEEAGFPSKEDSDWANFILNEKDPQIQKINKDSGDYDKAYAILQQQKTARDLMIKEGKNPWIMKVKEVPDDVINGYGFKFNWKSAYENEKGEKLRATENDAEKLRKYIQEKMDAYENPDENLKDIAYKMKMTGKVDQALDDKGEMWSRFLESDRFPMFQKYLEDVQKYQKDKAVEKIFSGEDPTKVNYPILGPTDIPLSKEAVDFMLPISKEYAKENYEKIKGLKDIGAPLGVDAAANLLMTGAGTKLIGRASPTLSKVYSSVAAPITTEAGQVAFNDKPLDQAAVGALEGTLVNAGTPFGLERGGNLIERLFRGSPERVQKALNQAADKAREVAKKKKDGWIWLDNGVVFKEINGVPQQVQPTKRDLARIISQEDLKAGEMGDRAKLFGQTPFSKMVNKVVAAKNKSDPTTARMNLISKLSKNETPSLNDIQIAGFKTRESFMNWLSSLPPDALRNYATNIMGRDRFGQRMGGAIANVYAPNLNLFKDKKDRDKGSDKWYRYYGLK